ncbi:MAG: aspartate aminotransferase family protein [Ferroplasma sp.]
MLKQFPDKGRNLNEISSELEKYSKNDIKNSRGRLFTYFYDPGLPELEDLDSLFLTFSKRNGMDYHAFPSTIKIENDVIAMMLSLLHGSEEAAGTFTTGGTESIILAMKSARDAFLEKHSGIPEVILPVTGHPSFGKAAEYLGLKIRTVGVDSSFKADTESIEKAINSRTAMIVASSPAFPYGIMDPISEISEIAESHKIWFHVDACVGGMILPFLSRLGKSIPDYDFKLSGVSSISVDLHKYGFTPKGSSVILYKNAELRRHQIYVDANWPGYPMSNAGIQATKSAGPLAGSWALMNYLGIAGYTELAGKTLKAFNTISHGIEKIGYKITGKPDATILAFQDGNNDIFETGIELIERGWYPQVQPSNVALGLPSTVHLNVSPVHLDVADEFLAVLSEVYDKVQKIKNSEDNKNIFKNSKNAAELLELIDKHPENKTLFFHILYSMDPKTGAELFQKMTEKDFTAAKN